MNLRITKQCLHAALIAAAALVAVVILGAAALVYTGWYDVSATGQHTQAVYQFLETAMKRSVQQRAAGMPVPDLDRPGRAEQGLAHFRQHCVQCHGAPGVAPEPFALGLTPAPASLVATAREWPAADIFWVIRQGVRMSGMPAWQYRLEDHEIWDVVAFMKVLPTLSPAQYQAWKPTPPAHQTGQRQAAPPPALRPGDPQIGREALQQYLCATCHAIPGIAGANRQVGPPLGGIADQQYIAGVLPNTQDNMAHWLRKPTQVDPLTAMPDLGVTEQDARDIAAFLHTLRANE